MKGSEQETTAFPSKRPIGGYRRKLGGMADWRAGRDKSGNRYTLVISDISQATGKKRSPLMSLARSIAEELARLDQASRDNSSAALSRQQIIGQVAERSGASLEKAKKAVDKALQGLRKT